MPCLTLAGLQASRQAMAIDICKITTVDDLPAWAVMGCAASSGAVAAIITNPADVVKVRLQV